MKNGFKYPTLHVFFFLFFLVFRGSGSSSVCFVKKQFPDLSAYSLPARPDQTREVQGKRERERVMDENLFRKRTKICLRISCAAAAANKQTITTQPPTPPKKRIKKKTQTSITKTNSPHAYVQPHFFQLPILSGIGRRNLALTEKFRGNSHHEGMGGEGAMRTAMGDRPQQPDSRPLRICLLWF